MSTNRRTGTWAKGLCYIQNRDAWKNSLPFVTRPEGTKGKANTMAAGRKVNPLTAAKKESTEARNVLKAMVNSYCDVPSTKKAKKIAEQLEKVEEAERVIREEKAASESLLFGSDGEEEEETDEEETEEETAQDSEEKDEEEKPAIPRPVTARNQNRNK